MITLLLLFWEISIPFSINTKSFHFPSKELGLIFQLSIFCFWLCFSHFQQYLEDHSCKVFEGCLLSCCGAFVRTGHRIQDTCIQDGPFYPLRSIFGPLTFLLKAVFSCCDLIVMSICLSLMMCDHEHFSSAMGHLCLLWWNVQLFSVLIDWWSGFLLLFSECSVQIVDITLHVRCIAHENVSSIQWGVFWL